MEEILRSNAQEYFKQAQVAEKLKAYNSAVVLYFKTIASLVDLFIYLQELSAPSNHTERFRILRSKHREIYTIIDRDFSVYQQSYQLKLTKEHVEVLKNDLAKIQAITKIKANSEE